MLVAGIQPVMYRWKILETRHLVELSAGSFIFFIEGIVVPIVAEDPSTPVSGVQSETPERRRAGRADAVSPQLLPLLRGTEDQKPNAIVYDQTNLPVEAGSDGPHYFAVKGRGIGIALVLAILFWTLLVFFIGWLFRI